MTDDGSFEAFWLHFVRSHTRPATWWMHTAGVVIFCAGATRAVQTRRVVPLVVSGAAFGVFAVAAHPLFEGNWPENTNRLFYGVLANFRMAFHTLRGTMAAEVERGLRAE